MIVSKHVQINFDKSSSKTIMTMISPQKISKLLKNNKNNKPPNKAVPFFHCLPSSNQPIFLVSKKGCDFRNIKDLLDIPAAARKSQMLAVLVLHLFQLFLALFFFHCRHVDFVTTSWFHCNNAWVVGLHS